jgi:hypothetical protein
MFSFAISAWQAWAPGMADFPAWQSWARMPCVPAAAAAPPDLGFLPPLQRRRLSPLARMAVACAWPLADGRPAMPMVYASHHGETSRNFELLQCLARDGALSPTSFSLSVHNATVGMWSILRKETVETVALSASGDGLENAMAEACLLLNAGHDEALVVLAEEAPPVEYRRWIDDIPFSYALALRVARGADFDVRMLPDDDGDADDGGKTHDGGNAGRGEKAADAGDDGTAREGAGDWPHPLNLLRHMLLGTAEWRHAARHGHWQWRRGS